MKKKIFDCIWAILLMVTSAVVVLIEEPGRASAFMLWLLCIILLNAYVSFITTFNISSVNISSSRKVKIAKVRDSATIPTKGSDEAAGFDLYACLDEAICIEPGKTVMVPTGISVELPQGTCAEIYARSGLASKRGLRPANCVGICDSDYRGEYMVALYNDSEEVARVEPNERIAQMIVKKYEKIEFNLVDKLSETKRGSGGFGSTGK